SNGPSTAAEPIEVELGDIFIAPQELRAMAGQNVTLNVTNTGATQHDLALADGPKTAMLGPGASEALDLGVLEAGTYTIFCSLPGHREGGMVASLMVGEEEHAAGSEANGGGRMLHNDEDY